MTPRSLLTRAVATLALITAAAAACGEPGQPPVLTFNLTPDRDTVITVGSFTVTIDSGTVSAATSVSVGLTTDVPPHVRLIPGTAVSITFDPVVAILKDVRLDLGYGSIALGPTPEHTLRFAKVVNGAWNELAGSQLDTALNRVVLATREFSDFGVFARPPGTLEATSTVSQTGAPGGAVSEPPAVLVRDTDGAPLAAVPVAFAATAGGGTVTPSVVISNSSGMAATTSWTLGALGANTVVASIAGSNVTSVTFDATAEVAGPGSMTAISPTNQVAAPGAPVASPPGVVVLDTDDNPLPGVNVTFSVTAGGGAINPTSVTTDAQGEATTTSWTLGGAAGVNTVVASIGGGIGDVTFNATATDPGGVLFAADWDNGLGTGDDAVMDGPSGSRAWDFRTSTSSTIQSVVTGTSVGFPASMPGNAVLFPVDGANGGRLGFTNRLPAPVVGTKWYHRMLLRLDITSPNQSIEPAHWVQGPSGNCAFVWSWRWGTEGGGVPRIRYTTDGGPSGPNGSVVKWELTGSGTSILFLDPTAVYQIHWSVEFVDAGGGQLAWVVEIRVYDAAGTLLWDTDDFYDTGDNVRLSTSRQHLLEGGLESCWRSWDFGNNGAAGWTATNDEVYFGAVEIRSDTWPTVFN